jgi:hypothetical protein
MRPLIEQTQWMFDCTDTRWFRMPMALRQRWWRETNYGREPPSDELRALIETEMARLEK